MVDTAPPILIIDTNRAFRIWRIDEIFTVNGTGRYVPNVDDGVWDWTQGLLRVTAVDLSTGISTLVIWKPLKDPNALLDQDILLGAGPGYQSESYRAYLDASVIPHTLALDKRLHIYGTTASYIKIFKGTNINQTGEVISAFYDQSGTFLGENIPLELVVMPDVNNIAVKTPMVGYSTRTLPDGEVVTVVAYDDAGQAVSEAKLLIKNTAFVRTTDASMKYIVAISVETPFLLASDPKTIGYPINMPVENLNLVGVVTYSDGSKLKMPVDGTKFSMFGLDNYIASVQGQKLPLVLNYSLSPGEFSYILQPSPDKHISEIYTATTLKSDGAFTLKLFAYPVWIDALSGYRLEYFLYTLERSTVYRVTNFVELATNSRAFNPIEFGTVQKLTVALDLIKVDSSFTAYRHVQTFDISLLANGNLANVDNWTVGFSPGQNPPYGGGLRAVASFLNVNDWRMNISAGITTKEEWLERVFYASKPLFDPDTEERAPEPNYFTLVSGAHRVEASIDQWNSIISMDESPPEGGLVFIEFIKRTQTTDLQLGVSAMIVQFPSA